MDPKHVIHLRDPGTAWLLVKVAAFTLVVPGTVVALVPYLLLADSSRSAVDFAAISALGLLPIVLGIALYSRCAHDFILTGRGTPLPIDAPVRIVTRGPYRYSRNPMYIGILAVVGGEALLFRDHRLLSYLFAVAVVFHVFIVGYEERALRRRFGDDYARYRAAVPRWLPGWTGLRALYRETFLKAGTLVLAAGTVAHVLRLSVGLPVIEMPDSIHAILVVLPAYAGLGCIVHARRIDLAGVHRKVIFGLITALLLFTAVMHFYSIVARDNQWLGRFPMWYSVLAAIVYCAFAYFMKTRTLTDR